MTYAKKRKESKKAKNCGEKRKMQSTEWKD